VGDWGRGGEGTRDAELMKSLVNYFNCGNYYPTSTGEYGEFVVKKLSDINEKIIPFSFSFLQKRKTKKKYPGPHPLQNKTAGYAVNKREDLVNIIIPHFYKYKLKGDKLSNYLA
jgi:hypothetical protein